MTHQLRIILLMIEPPLPFGNASARWYYVLLKGLVERGHRVTAFATCSKPEEIAQAQALFPPPDYNLRCYPHPIRSGLLAKWETWRRPYSYMFSLHLRKDLETQLNQGFDVLHLEQLWSGWLGLAHTERAVINLYYLHSIDLASQPSCSLRQRILRQLTRRAEMYLLRRYPVICTVSPRLHAHIHQITPTTDIHTIPLGMDLSLYPFRNGNQPGCDPVVGLIGSFHWYPTFSAGTRLLTRLWPEIKRRIPNARLQIVGREARSALKEFLDLSDVSIHENVPDSIPYFLSTDVLLYAPVRGSGMKVKILEAFAIGVPVVTTSEGVEGIPAEDGVHAGVCEDDAGLIERTVQLLQDRERQERYRQAARILLESHCSPDTTLDAVEQVYATLPR